MRDIESSSPNFTAWDEVIVFFANGDQTLMFVDTDDDIPTAINDLCDQHGWNSQDVTNYQVRQPISLWLDDIGD